MGALDELYDGPTAEPAPATPAQETPAAPAVASTPVAEPQAAPVETPAPAQPEIAAEPKDPMAPVRALMDERDRRQAAERKAAELEAWRAEQERKAREASEQMPHPLDDPDGFGAWLLSKQKAAVDGAVGSLRQQHQQQLETLSRTMMLRHLGAEKFAELEKFIEAAPDQAHALALREADPYGWFADKFEEAQKHRKAQDALKQLDSLGGKSIDEIVAERVAAELAKHTQAPPAAAAPAQAATPATPERPRNPDGTFAPSTSQPQRHQPVSLAAVDGVPVAPTASRGSAMEELYG